MLKGSKQREEIPDPGSGTACRYAGETKQSSPDPVDINKKPAHEVVQMPQGFRNVAEACDSGGNMILVTSRGSDFAGGQNGGGLSSGITVIIHDPRCAR